MYKKFILSLSYHKISDEVSSNIHLIMTEACLVLIVIVVVVAMRMVGKYQPNNIFTFNMNFKRVFTIKSNFICL